MVARDEIGELCEQIVSRFTPRAVILFGSYAWGVPASHSDVDLLVILPFQGSPIRKAGKFLAALDYHFPLDLLVRTPDQVAERIRLNDPFMRDIMTKGRVLYDAAGLGVGAKG